MGCPDKPGNDEFLRASGSGRRFNKLTLRHGCAARAGRMCRKRLGAGAG